MLNGEMNYTGSKQFILPIEDTRMTNAFDMTADFEVESEIFQFRAYYRVSDSAE